MSALNQLLLTLKVEANVFHNGQYCGTWAIDTSGTGRMNFHMVTHGRCFLHTCDEVIELRQGDSVFFPSDSSHRLSNAKNTNVALNQSVSQDLADNLQADGTGLVCGNFSDRHPQFRRLLSQLPASMVVRRESKSASAAVTELILAESTASGQSTNLLLNRLSDCLFYLLLRDHLDTQRGVFAALADSHLAAVMEVIHTSSEQRLSIMALAKIAGMSRSAFAAHFRTVLGQSPIEYLNEWRMTQAYRWLADDRVTTLDAALRCGYESEASFSKAFKRVMNLSPGQVRNR